MSRTKKKQTPSARRQPEPWEIDRVADQFDADELIHICQTWDFSDYATLVPLPEWSEGAKTDDRFYWYQNNGSDILAVAHLDTVQHDMTCQVIETAAGPLAVSGALDDRLGAYVILDLLPALGINCDILLTTDEEMGRSTGREFCEDFIDNDGQPAKEYNWIIQFDRGGTDVVMYQYETPEYANLVVQAGAVVGDGSYSDIAVLDDLGCAAFNWGVGYQEYHSPRSHAWLNDTFRSVARFVRFHSTNAGTCLPHEPLDYADDWLLYDCDPIAADCGHMIDLSDKSTYVELQWGDNPIVCNRPQCVN